MTQSQLQRKRDPRGRKPRDEIYARLDEGIQDLKTRLGGLPTPLEAQDIWGDIWYQEAHNSTALEGNTLILREVEILLHEGKAVGDKELSDYLEVSGYADAAKWVYSQALEPAQWSTGALLSLTEARYVHELAMSPVWQVRPHPDATPQERPGSFREHDIQPFPGGMKPPPWPEVPALTSDWIESVTRIGDDPLPFPEALADRHAHFERIHPFLDGNGRTGRLLMNLVLIRLGYPPAIIHKRERGRYLRVLRRADEGAPGPLGEFLARNILDTLHRFVVPAVAGPARLVPLAALADEELTLRALREAAVRGRLKAQRDDRGQWRSSRKWAEEYKLSRAPSGRRPTTKPGESTARGV
jgi:Fic/DOC family